MKTACRAPRGFTLLELLVVLAIVGLIASVVLPQLQNVARGVEWANQRNDIRIGLEGLGYQAYVRGRPMTLAGKYDGGHASPDLPLAIPSGWSVRFAQPVSYSVNGVCSGGRVSVTAPDASVETFELKPPRCRFESKEPAP